MFNVRTAALSIIAAGAFLTLAQPAFAADPDAVETLSRLVSTEGLNLANTGDQQVLRHRILAAAHHVCADLTVGGVSDGQARSVCINEAQAQGWAAAEVKISAAMSRTKLASSQP